MYKSKINILLTSTTLFFHIFDIKGVIATKFIEIFYVLILVILFGILLLMLHFFYTKKQVKAKTDADINNLANENNFTNSSDATQHILSKPKSVKSNYIFSKIVFALVISGVLLCAISVYKLRDLPIYYVVVKKNIESLDKAVKIKNEIGVINESLASADSYNVTILRQSKFRDLYLITINGGYLDQQKANEVLDNIKSSCLKKGYRPYVSPPDKDAHPIKKIKYVNSYFMRLIGA
jgi:hypothetical protein